MGGHLFITRGDLQHLACDAILVPSGVWSGGRRGHVQEQWRAVTGASDDGFVPHTPKNDDWAVFPIQADRWWPDPGIWVGHTGEDARTPTDDAATLVRFIKEAGDFVSGRLARRVRRTQHGSDRPLGSETPLLGVPIVGTGKAGRAAIKGEVIVEIVRALLAAVQHQNVDVVLVTRDDAHYSAAQQARVRYATAARQGLDADLRAPLEFLVGMGRREQLVLFLGAGVSMGAGLPSWSELLGELIELAGLESSLTPKQRRGMDARDVATLVRIALRKRTRRPLSQVVCDATKGHLSVAADGCPRVSLVHQLIAALPVREAITTNYDTLFEQAWRDVGRDPVVFPGGRTNLGREWLLKLHGSIDNPKDIVLSRDDYLRFEGKGSVLAGMVQAMLLTRHLLFVGYSLSDDNFHRMVHQVRAISTNRVGRRPRVGTVLTPASPGVLDPIWAPEIEFVSTASAENVMDPRQQAIFLDHLAAELSPPGAHLLDQSYSRVFTDAELALRDAVVDLIDRSKSEDVREGLRVEVQAALQRFGGNPAG